MTKDAIAINQRTMMMHSINTFQNFVYPGVKTERQRLDRDVQQFRTIATADVAAEAARRHYESELVVNSAPIRVYDEYDPAMLAGADPTSLAHTEIKIQQPQPQHNASLFSLFAYANGMRPGMPLDTWSEYLSSYIASMYHYLPGAAAGAEDGGDDEEAVAAAAAAAAAGLRTTSDSPPYQPVHLSAEFAGYDDEQEDDECNDDDDDDDDDDPETRQAKHDPYLLYPYPELAGSPTTTTATAASTLAFNAATIAEHDADLMLPPAVTAAQPAPTTPVVHHTMAAPKRVSYNAPIPPPPRALASTTPVSPSSTLLQVPSARQRPDNLTARRSSASPSSVACAVAAAVATPMPSLPAANGNGNGASPANHRRSLSLDFEMMLVSPGPQRREHDDDDDAANQCNQQQQNGDGDDNDTLPNNTWLGYLPTGIRSTISNWYPAQ